MRPEMADLIRGSIYKNLNDAANVHKYEHILGMTKDLFFFTHEKFEKSVRSSLTCHAKYPFPSITFLPL